VAALVKALAYTGVVLLVGAGLFRFFVGPELSVGMRRALCLGTLLGAALVVLGSVGDVLWSLWQLVGRFDPALTWDYAQSTNHGRATLVRLALTLPLVLLTFWEGLPRPLHRTLYILVGLGTLGTFSFLSHAAVMHGALPLLADLEHFAVAALWGGAVIYTALSPAWGDAAQRGALLRTVRRVSSVGLFSVLLLAVTGTYAAALHLDGPGQLATVPYGRALSLKLALVLAILGIAALNRWWFLPALLKRGTTKGFGRALKLEALLLLLVLVATGVLTTRPLPHG